MQHWRNQENQAGNRSGRREQRHKRQARSPVGTSQARVGNPTTPPGAIAGVGIRCGVAAYVRPEQCLEPRVFFRRRGCRGYVGRVRLIVSLLFANLITPPGANARVAIRYSVAAYVRPEQCTEPRVFFRG